MGNSRKLHPFKGATPEALARALLKPVNTREKRNERSGATERRRVERRASDDCPGHS